MTSRRKVFEVRAGIFEATEVQVRAGKCPTTTIEITVLDEGVEMKDAHFNLYVAKDAAHTPVLLEATLPFAVARVELVKRSG